MNKNHLLLITLLTGASAMANAQSLPSFKDLFLRMPESICPALSEYNRLELVDNQRNDKPMRTRNTYKTFSNMETLTDSYAHLVVSKSAEKIFRVLPTKADSKQDAKTNADLAKKTNADLAKKTNADLAKKTNADLAKNTNADLDKKTKADLAKKTNADLDKKTKADLAAMKADSAIIMVITTVHSDSIIDSSVSFYSTTWQPLPSERFFPQSVSEDFRLINMTEGSDLLSVSILHPLTLNLDGSNRPVTPAPPATERYVWDAEAAMFKLFPTSTQVSARQENH